MKLFKLIFLFILFCTPNSVKAAEIEWRVVTTRNVSMAVPDNVVDGYQNAIFFDGRDIGTNFSPSDASIKNFALWSIETQLSPYDYLKGRVEVIDHITYYVDKRLFGVLSGTTGDAIFYNVCKRVEAWLSCFELQYTQDARELFDKALPRMLKTFKAN